MLIWDFIRDFFVRYIFGGRMSNGTNIQATLGKVAADGTANISTYTYSLFVPIGKHFANNSLTDVYMSIGDWLSTVATIITMTVILVAIGLFIRWLFRLVSGLITFRG